MTSLSSDKIIILKFFINLYKLEWQWPFSKLTDEQMDKVRRIVHQKLKPFHFQMKSYYLYGANYPTDDPSPVWKRPMFARENENMLNKLFGPDGICVFMLYFFSHFINQTVLFTFRMLIVSTDTLLLRSPMVSWAAVVLLKVPSEGAKRWCSSMCWCKFRQV